MFFDADIHRAAKELVERYGDDAMAVAHERVAALFTAQDRSATHIALRVLSAVEILLAGERPRDDPPPRYFGRERCVGGIIFELGCRTILALAWR